MTESRDNVAQEYLFLVATIVAVGIKEVRTLLVGAVVIVPAAAAKALDRITINNVS